MQDAVAVLDPKDLVGWSVVVIGVRGVHLASFVSL